MSKKDKKNYRNHVSYDEKAPSYIQKVHFVNGDDTLNLICGVVYI